MSTQLLSPTQRSATVGALLFAVCLCAHGGEKPGFPLPQHVDQKTIHLQPYEKVHHWGRLLFEAPFNSLDGVGTNLLNDPPDSIRKRFVRSPRADLPAWMASFRPDGPQAQNCLECHNERAGNVLNENRDPFRQADIRLWVERQVTRLHGVGALQILAEQTTKELWAMRDRGLAQARRDKKPVKVVLTTSNDVNFGSLIAYPDGTLDMSAVEGVNRQDELFTFSKALQVLPMQMKGIAGFIRRFVGQGSDVTMGLQSPERVPENIDADNDGVIGELTTGDTTAMTVYVASTPRPVTRLELHRHLGGKYRLSPTEIASIQRGERIFAEVGCTDCHKPVAHLRDATFREPSATPGYQFPFFWTAFVTPDTPPTGPLGTDPLPYGYDPANPFKFDITKLPLKCPSPYRFSNAAHSSDANADAEFASADFGSSHRGNGGRHPKNCFLQFESDGRGGAYVRLYGDQKRHDMGQGLAEEIDEFGTGAATWRTKELWGVGSAGPWLHDGRATTLTEAIHWHGGEAQQQRDRYFSLGESRKDDVIAFLKNLVIYDAELDKIY